MNKTGSLNKIRSRPTGRWASAAGQSTIELALVLPVLLGLLLVAADFGRVFYTTIGLHSAARAGAQYGSHTGITAADATGMVRSAELDGSIIPGLSATATNCTCLTLTPQTVPACPASYCTYNPQASYVIVTTSTTFKTVGYYPAVPSPLNLSGTAIMQVQP
jgi:Flp pilus assembly protein TadG